MAGPCVFCGFTGKMTGEHVLGDWLGKIGLSQDPVLHITGPLSRSPRDIGVRPPFRQEVRDVCGSCNNGWMGRLEGVAARVLTRMILGRAGTIERNDQAAIVRWATKTALVGMLLSSDRDRAAGYGVPASEYQKLYALREQVQPLPNTQFWIGRYSGSQRLASLPVTPMVMTFDGLTEPDHPHGYVMTLVLGELLLQGVRFTSSWLELPLIPDQGFGQIWPASANVLWPTGQSVGDQDFQAVVIGANLVSGKLPQVRPWKPAVELSRSALRGSAVRLPTPCGKHAAFYPAILAVSGRQGVRHAFVTSCECQKAYLVVTEADGAHFKAEGAAPQVGALYEELEGEEDRYDDGQGGFVYKRLSSRA
jgi:hypothetical protein